MREHERIDRISDKLRAYWKNNPNYRFLQMLINMGIIPDGDHWHVEDKDIEAKLDKNAKVIFENDRIRKPFKIKGALTDKPQYQIIESNGELKLIDYSTKQEASHEDIFYLLGKEIEIMGD